MGYTLCVVIIDFARLTGICHCQYLRTRFIRICRMKVRFLLPSDSIFFSFLSIQYRRYLCSLFANAHCAVCIIIHSPHPATTPITDRRNPESDSWRIYLDKFTGFALHLIIHFPFATRRSVSAVAFARKDAKIPTGVTCLVINFAQLP